MACRWNNALEKNLMFHELTCPRLSTCFVTDVQSKPWLMLKQPNGFTVFSAELVWKCIRGLRSDQSTWCKMYRSFFFCLIMKFNNEHIFLENEKYVYVQNTFFLKMPQCETSRVSLFLHICKFSFVSWISSSRGRDWGQRAVKWNSHAQ